VIPNSHVLDPLDSLVKRRIWWGWNFATQGIRNQTQREHSV
jgi:hypothetical protein